MSLPSIIQRVSFDFGDFAKDSGSERERGVMYWYSYLVIVSTVQVMG